MHIARQALTRFRLHAVWWLVSPGNPLKTDATVSDYAQRVTATDAFVKHPRMVATALEGALGTRYTRDTLRMLTRYFPRTHFVWIAGMDNARSFHRWQHWDTLPALMPFVFFDRPPAAEKIKGNRLRQRKGLRQRTKARRPLLAHDKTMVFWMLQGHAVDLSSTAIRRAAAVSG